MSGGHDLRGVRPDQGGNLLPGRLHEALRFGNQVFLVERLADVVTAGSDEGIGNGATRDQLIDAMIAHPKLIERPIVIKNGKAAIGRPPEKVLEIL